MAKELREFVKRHKSAPGLAEALREAARKLTGAA